MEPPGSARHRWENREVEWSFWEKRHRRKNCEGSGEQVGEGASVKWAGAHESTWEANEFHFLNCDVVRLIRPGKLCARLACSTSNLKYLT